MKLMGFLVWEIKYGRAYSGKNVKKGGRRKSRCIDC